MIQLVHGDCLEGLKKLPDNYVDSIVTDPPYGLSFMGKKWDYDVPSEDIWRECLRVLKPGGHLLAFAGTRTQHRMAVRIEDAGFEIRDMIAWVYGSGFPKSLDVSKALDKKLGEVRGTVKVKPRPETSGTMAGANDTRPWIEKSRELGYHEVADKNPVSEAAKLWEGWGTALKPALEPITVARKPLAEKTVAENVLQHGTGGLNIDESRVEYQSEADKASATPQGKCTSNTSAGSAPDVDMSEVDYNGEKYWYKNEYKWLIDKWLNDEDYVWSELKENLETYNWCKVPEIDNGDRVLFDSQEGECIRLYESKRKEFERPKQLGRFPANLIHDGSEEVVELFPESKDGVAVRHKGVSNAVAYGGNIGRLPPGTPDMGYGGGGSAARFFYCAKSSKADRTNDGDVDNKHPTVKPTDLMRYLCRLVTPPGGIVLDPFMGSGSTGKAAVKEGFSFIGIEREAEYVEIAKERINHV